ncbi:protein of unknown function [Magnetospirillum sp. XM-1]|nr:protein of unknown function [Magnetospirillum sp. XM-1]
MVVRIAGDVVMVCLEKITLKGKMDFLASANGDARTQSASGRHQLSAGPGREAWIHYVAEGRNLAICRAAGKDQVHAVRIGRRGFAWQADHRSVRSIGLNMLGRS